MPMTENPPVSRKRKKECGAFFTPYPIASDMIRIHGIHRKWSKGASVLDPTAGDGSLLEALIRCCRDDDIPVTPSMISRLKGYEKEEDFIQGFPKRIQQRYGLALPNDVLECRDFLKVPPSSYDILFGNPPWLNFTDVREDEKEEVKEYFVRYGLTGGGRGILLGGSRIDLAALMIQKGVQDHLTPGGSAYFFIPLSLMLNEGAHNVFRRGRISSGTHKNTTVDRFCFTEIRDFGEQEIFTGVQTRSGFIALKKSSDPVYPLPYYTLAGSLSSISWHREEARPVGKEGTAFAVSQDHPPNPVTIQKASRPRQGINTGGRNSLFIFDRCEEAGQGLWNLENREISARLPGELIYPLVNRLQFRGEENPVKYIFLPYNSLTGRPLNPEELKEYPAARDYLEHHKNSLETRKGTLIGNAINKGLYWSLLGVGPYSFSPWKIVWEAYGKHEFAPRIFGKVSAAGGLKPWIPNQALQASCSFESQDEAEQVLEGLKQPAIEGALKKHRMEGTCNWAQPGRIRHFLKEI